MGTTFQNAALTAKKKLNNSICCCMKYIILMFIVVPRTAVNSAQAPMFVLIYNGRIFGDELAKLITLNVININKC